MARSQARGGFSPLMIALIAGGGYVAYRKYTEPSWDPLAWFKGLFGGTTTTTTTTVAPLTPEQEKAQTQATIAEAARATTIALMIDEAKKQNFPDPATYDEWNWLYHKVRGTDGPNFEDVMNGKPRDYKMNMSEYWSYVIASGLGSLFVQY